jgi:hypothetical protein
MSKREGWTAYFSFYLPKKCYVLNTSSLTEEELTEIQKTVTTALFRKCGFNCNTATAVKFGPPRLGGIGFRGLYMEQSLLLTCMVLKHFRIPGQAHTLIRIALSWAQLASRVGFPTLEFPELAIPTLEDPFLQGIRSGLMHLNASLRLHDNLVCPLARSGNFYIMEGLESTGVFSSLEALRANYCRLYLRAYLASDVIEPAGTRIHSGMFWGTLSQRPNTPSVKFPRQARPNKESWKQWRRALRLLFTAPRCTQLLLLDPLGSWYPLRTDSPKWYFYKSTDLLVARSCFTNAITQYSVATRGRRAQTFLKQIGQLIPAIPPDCVPISPPTADRRQWTIPPDAGTNFIPAPPLQPLPHTFSGYAGRLDPALRELVLDVEILVPIAEIVALLERTTTLTLVGDGGAKTCRGSFGAVAALDSI